MNTFVKTLQGGDYPVELHRCNSKHWMLRTFTMEYHFARRRDALEYHGTDELWGSGKEV